MTTLAIKGRPWPLCWNAMPLNPHPHDHCYPSNPEPQTATAKAKPVSLDWNSMSSFHVGLTVHGRECVCAARRPNLTLSQG
jgi:hypothetical protein